MHFSRESRLTLDKLIAARKQSKMTKSTKKAQRKGNHQWTREEQARSQSWMIVKIHVHGLHIVHSRSVLVVGGNGQRVVYMVARIPPDMNS